ncbi:MAG TPA: sigma-70 family RNA polymerase sigma factor [Candidatus Eisenbacteria bacterium]|nr:sigma-70 family RNA polymerase sigma factor [Candidatus Eisenbacteria bacterium]
MRPEMTVDRDRRHDATLAAGIAAGEEAQFMVVYDRHADLLFASVVRLLGDRDTAAEIVQESFLALWRRASQYDSRAGSLIGWLLAIARNRAIDHLRAQSRRPVLTSISVAGDANGQLDALDVLDLQARRVDGPGVAPADPATVADRRWSQSVVRSMISELPETERQAVVLAYAAGLSQAEIADRLGWPLGTVKSRTRRAMAHLRVRLAEVPDLVDPAAARRRDPSTPVADRATFGTER